MRTKDSPPYGAPLLASLSTLIFEKRLDVEDALFESLPLIDREVRSASLQCSLLFSSPPLRNTLGGTVPAELNMGTGFLPLVSEGCPPFLLHCPEEHWQTVALGLGRASERGIQHRARMMDIKRLCSRAGLSRCGCSMEQRTRIAEKRRAECEGYDHPLRIYQSRASGGFGVLTYLCILYFFFIFPVYTFMT